MLILRNAPFPNRETVYRERLHTISIINRVTKQQIHYLNGGLRIRIMLGAWELKTDALMDFRNLNYEFMQNMFYVSMYVNEQ